MTPGLSFRDTQPGIDILRKAWLKNGCSADDDDDDFNL
jgi:hypothetical protein